MKKLVLAIVLALAIFTTSGAHAVAIAVFDNPAYVDSGGSSSSSGALQSLLLGQGHTVSTFAGLSAADFTAATAASDLLLFPDLLNFGELATVLDGAAKSALASYVVGGGGLMTAGGSGHRLLDVVFYPGCVPGCFASSGSGSDNFRQDAAATGTPYASAPGVLAQRQTDGLNLLAFSPAGVLNLYRDEVGGFPNSTTVLTAPFGGGQFGYLAWSFAGATPANAGGWDQVLNIMVLDLAQPAAVPVPGPLWLVAPLVLLLLGRRVN